MLRVDVYAAKAGMKLSLSVRHPRKHDQTLLKRGYTLTEADIRRLSGLKVSTIWVHYPGLEFLSKFVNQAVIHSQGPVVQQVADTFESVQSESSVKIPYHEYCDAVESMVDELVSNPNAVMFLGDLAVGDCPDLIRHSSTVTYLSLLIGCKLESYLVRQRKHVEPNRAKKVVELGVGAMLHDLGIPKLEESVRDRYLATGNELDLSWQEHPSVGYDMVKSHIPPSASTIVLNHHQRFDGSGYAGQGRPVLAGERAHVFARIVALADQFDRMRHPVNSTVRSTVSVLGELINGPMAEGFDPQVLRGLLMVVPPYPPGSVVKLSDGQWAVCIDHNPTDPCCPVVQVIASPDCVDYEEIGPPGPSIDLSQEDGTLWVAEHEGASVSGHNFQPPELTQDIKHALHWA